MSGTPGDLTRPLATRLTRRHDPGRAGAADSNENRGMTESDVTAAPFSGRTRWVRRVRGPAWVFLRTETGSAVILVIATVAALLWANIDPSGYQRIWATELQIRLGGSAVSLDLRGWVN